ncbi:uncharacterized protein LOC118745528 [Rhagoletis pomonella]|uniref:uncharacterized protein LOC118745528 n=1 Tax=Rhagoletis pomonella TaxID=28610 RepID=UPI001786C50E|nr:uncharacterized protein LOC118745528 [Rhagoletis pomonella]
MILQQCPLYDELEDVFGYREFAAVEGIIDSEDNSAIDRYSPTFDIIDDDLIEVVSEELPHTGNDEVENEALVPSPSTLVQANAEAINTPVKSLRKGIYSRTALSQVLEVNSSLLEVRKHRNEMELGLKKEELALKAKEV